jgi:hypothetical protein
MKLPIVVQHQLVALSLVSHRSVCMKYSYLPLRKLVLMSKTPIGYGIRDKVLEIRDKVSGIRDKG